MDTETPTDVSTTTTSSGGSSGFTNSTRFPSRNSTHLLDQFEHLVELLEERIISDLERRGGRFRGGF